jgi:hypothetical protein
MQGPKEERGVAHPCCSNTGDSALMTSRIGEYFFFFVSTIILHRYISVRNASFFLYSYRRSFRMGAWLLECFFFLVRSIDDRELQHLPMWEFVSQQPPSTLAWQRLGWKQWLWKQRLWERYRATLPSLLTRPSDYACKSYSGR